MENGDYDTQSHKSVNEAWSPLEEDWTWFMHSPLEFLVFNTMASNSKIRSLIVNSLIAGGLASSMTSPSVFQNINSPALTGPMTPSTINGQGNLQQNGGSAPKQTESTDSHLHSKGLQFLLFCELKAGMIWQYSLLIISCSVTGQPSKVRPQFYGRDSITKYRTPLLLSSVSHLHNNIIDIDSAIFKMASFSAI